MKRIQVLYLSLETSYVFSVTEQIRGLPVLFLDGPLPYFSPSPCGMDV